MNSVVDYYQNTFNEDTRLEGVVDNRHKLEREVKLKIYRRYIREINPKRVLDSSCGTGLYTRILAKEFPDVEFVATDIVPDHIATLKSKCDLPNVSFLVCDNLRLGELLDGTFDMIIVGGALYHLPLADSILALEEAEKLLGQGGVLLVDFLPEKHAWLQNILRFKESKAGYDDFKQDGVFHYKSRADFPSTVGKVQLDTFYTTDLFLRYAYKDLNQLSSDNIDFFIDSFLGFTGQDFGTDSDIIDYSEHAIAVYRSPNSPDWFKVGYSEEVIDYLELSKEILGNLKESGLKEVKVFINPNYYLHKGYICDLGIFSTSNIRDFATVLKDASKEMWNLTNTDYIRGADWLDFFDRNKNPVMFKTSELSNLFPL